MAFHQLKSFLCRQVLIARDQFQSRANPAGLDIRRLQINQFPIVGQRAGYVGGPQPRRAAFETGFGIFRIRGEYVVVKLQGSRVVALGVSGIGIR